jgi:hypothetical protein
VTTIFGCFGLRDSKWSPVRIVEDDEDDDAARSVSAFGRKFTITVDGSSTILREEDGGIYRREPIETLGIERLR